jgi:hypothetical protein
LAAPYKGASWNGREAVNEFATGWLAAVLGDVGCDEGCDHAIPSTFRRPPLRFFGAGSVSSNEQPDPKGTFQRHGDHRARVGEAAPLPPD